MKILVVGAGAVGSTIGGMLAQAGHDVTLVGRDPHMMRIAASGLLISGLWGDYHVKNVRALKEIPSETPDWILLTTKAYDTEAMAGLLAERFPDDIPVLHLQNGIGNADLLAAKLGWPRIVSGMIIIGFQIPMAGRTVVTVSADKIRIGRKNGKLDERIRSLVDAFNAAKMPAEAVNDIQKKLWDKALYNASLNALAGILGVQYGDLLAPHPWTLIEQLVHEAFKVLKAEKQPVSWTTAGAYLDYLRTYQVPATFHHKPSMLSDLHHGRRTEIDFINGAFSVLGKTHRIPTPVNDTVTQLVHALEANSQNGILHPSLQHDAE